VRKESEESDRLLKERLQRADAQRLELEDELSRCKIGMASDRLAADEQLAATKQRIRNEEVSLMLCQPCVQSNKSIPILDIVVVAGSRPTLDAINV